jgi:hypothetical protein
MTCLPRWLLSTGLRRNGSSGHCDLTMFTYSVMRFTAATRQGNRAAGGEGTERCGRRGVTSHGADPFLLLNEVLLPLADEASVFLCSAEEQQYSTE